MFFTDLSRIQKGIQIFEKSQQQRNISIDNQSNNKSSNNSIKSFTLSLRNKIIETKTINPIGEEHITVTPITESTTTTITEDSFASMKIEQRKQLWNDVYSFLQTEIAKLNQDQCYGFEIIEMPKFFEATLNVIIETGELYICGGIYDTLRKMKQRNDMADEEIAIFVRKQITIWDNNMADLNKAMITICGSRDGYKHNFNPKLFDNLYDNFGICHSTGHTVIACDTEEEREKYELRCQFTGNIVKNKFGVLELSRVKANVHQGSPSGKFIRERSLFVIGMDDEKYPDFHLQRLMALYSFFGFRATLVLSMEEWVKEQKFSHNLTVDQKVAVFHKDVPFFQHCMVLFTLLFNHTIAWIRS